jgi:4-hydroxyacetophenone monooxygenase
MMSCALVDDVPVEYGELLSEEMGFLSRDIAVPESAVPDDFFVVVIGAGLSGLCMAIKLAATGIRFVIVEKARAASGTR